MSHHEWIVVLAVVAGVLCGIELVVSRLRSMLAWAGLAVAVACLLIVDAL